MTKNTYFKNAHIQFLAAITDINQLTGWLEDHPEQIGIAMVGRSNVGKSSLINALYGKKTARVSNTPGRTQSINIFSFTMTPEGPTYFLYDLPGYGHAQVSKQMRKKWNMLLSLFFENLPEDIALLNIQDARHPLQKTDLEFMHWLKHFPHLTCHLCLNKFDKLKKQKDRSQLTKILKDHKELMAIYTEKFKVSAQTEFGLDHLFDSLILFLQANR